ncbi:MAG: hypothetical protein ACYC49_01525 [Ignavibacteriaceae bacterium]
MVDKFEYNFNTQKNSGNNLPEKINLNSNEYLFPLKEGMMSLIFDALEQYKDRTSLDEEKILIQEFFASIEKLGNENLLGKISGYYLVTSYKNLKWRDSKQVRLEIKII